MAFVKQSLSVLLACCGHLSAQTFRVYSSFQRAASRAVGALWIILCGVWSSLVILGA